MIFKKSFLLIILIFSVSCWGPSKRQETLVNGLVGQKFVNATFRVAGVENSSVIPILEKGLWKVPYSLRYKFRVKVVSQKDARAVVGHEFYIKSEKGKLIKETTKASGWLEWHEDVSFNFFSNNPSYLVLKREVVGRGLHQGSYPVELALNPWAIFRSKHPSFVHLDKKNRLPANLVSFGSEQVRQSKGGFDKSIVSDYPLDMANAKVFISQLTEYQNHVNLEIKLEMNLLAKMKDAYGENILYKLKSGKVRAFVSLMATNIGKDSKEHAILFHSTRPLFVQFTAQDRAIISYKGTLYNQFYRGNLAIAIRLVPEGVSLAPFEALYSLGSYQKLIGTHSLILEENSSEKQLSSSGQPFSYDGFLKTASNLKKLQAKKYLTAIKPYRIKKAEVFHQGVVPGETALVRTVGFRTRMCVVHSWTGLPVINEHFIVSFESKLLKTSHYTNKQGCLSLVATTSHKVYKPQKYFIRNFHIYHDPDHNFDIKNFKTLTKKYKRFNQKVSLYLNPWDERFGNFGYDTRNSDAEYIRRISDPRRIASKFFLQSFSYNTLGFKYKVDSHLNLEIRKRLQLVLEPYVLRYHSLSFGRDEFHKTLRDGVYLMKVAFQKTYLKPDASGVTISKMTDPKERQKKVQSTINSIPLEKQSLLQSSIKDLERGDKYFSKLSITGFSAKDLQSIDLESRLLTLDEIKYEGEDKLYSPRTVARATEYISAYQKLIKVQNGLIIEPVALKVNNPILMKIRGQLLIQLEAVDETLLQVARVFDKNVSKEAEKILNKNNSVGKTLSELAIIRQLVSNKKTANQLKLFVDKKQKKLNQLIRFLKKRSKTLTDSSKNHVGSSVLSDDFKTLLKEFSFTKADIEEVEENGFVKVTGRSVLDPNIFVAEDSGLEPRTFIAPVTLVRYDNNSYMRPTDSLTLDSCGKEDCLIRVAKSNASLSITSLINKADAITNLGRKSKLTHEYFEHENRLANVSVDQLIARQKTLDQREKKKFLGDASFALYTHLYNLDYVSNYSVLEKEDLCFKSSNVSEICNKKMKGIAWDKRYKNQIHKWSFNDFKSKLKSNFTKHKGLELKHFVPQKEVLITNKDLQDIIDTGTIKKNSVRAIICEYLKSRLSHKQLVDYTLSRLSPEINEVAKEGFRTAPSEELRSSLRCNSLEFFNEKIATSSFYKVYKVHTESSSYQEGQSYNISVSSNFSLRQSMASRFDANPISDPAALLGISGLGGVPYRFGFAKSKENSFTLISQVLLSIQQSAISFNLLYYKKCAVVRFDKVLRGVLLCGKLQTKQKKLTEHYYYISQHFTPGDQLDMGALYNHPWLIRMRGDRDIAVFVKALRRDKESIVNPFSKVSDEPLQILDFIKGSYESFMPGFPSHYQILK